MSGLSRLNLRSIPLARVMRLDLASTVSLAPWPGSAVEIARKGRDYEILNLLMPLHHPTSGKFWRHNTIFSR